MSGNIGLTDLSLVGSAMADRFNVVGFDIEKAKCEQLERFGTVAVNSPAQVAEQAGRIILSLPDTDAVLQVVEDPGGIIKAKSRGGSRTALSYIIDTTTGELDNSAVIREIQRRAKE